MPRANRLHSLQRHRRLLVIVPVVMVQYIVPFPVLLFFLHLFPHDVRRLFMLIGPLVVTYFREVVPRGAHGADPHRAPILPIVRIFLRDAGIEIGHAARGHALRPRRPLLRRRRLRLRGPLAVRRRGAHLGRARLPTSDTIVRLSLFEDPSLSLSLFYVILFIFLLLQGAFLEPLIDR